MENDSNLIVKIIKGGPFVVKGDFKLDMPGKEKKHFSNKTLLCRCGLSTEKPFCDGSHIKSDFDK